MKAAASSKPIIIPPWGISHGAKTTLGRFCVSKFISYNWPSLWQFPSCSKWIFNTTMCSCSLHPRMSKPKGRWRHLTHLFAIHVVESCFRISVHSLSLMQRRWFSNGKNCRLLLGFCEMGSSEGWSEGILTWMRKRFCKSISRLFKKLRKNQKRKIIFYKS